jgi:hypothetical protein
MKRFLKVLILLVVALCALMSGVDMTLDHLAHAPAQSAFMCYSPKGQIIVAYHGNLAQCPAYTRPAPVFVHRAAYTPPAVD